MENIIKRALVITTGPFITAQDLPDHLQTKNVNDGSIELENSFSLVSKDYATYKEMKARAKRKLEENFDKQFISDLLKENQGNISQAARGAKIIDLSFIKWFLNTSLMPTNTNQARAPVRKN